MTSSSQGLCPKNPPWPILRTGYIMEVLQVQFHSCGNQGQVLQSTRLLIPASLPWHLLLHIIHLQNQTPCTRIMQTQISWPLYSRGSSLKGLVCRHHLQCLQPPPPRHLVRHFTHHNQTSWIQNLKRATVFQVQDRLSVTGLMKETMTMTMMDMALDHLFQLCVMMLNVKPWMGAMVTISWGTWRVQFCDSYGMDHWAKLRRCLVFLRFFSPSCWHGRGTANVLVLFQLSCRTILWVLFLDVILSGNYYFSMLKIIKINELESLDHRNTFKSILLVVTNQSRFVFLRK